MTIISVVSIIFAALEGVLVIGNLLRTEEKYLNIQNLFHFSLTILNQVNHIGFLTDMVKRWVNTHESLILSLPKEIF